MTTLKEARYLWLYDGIVASGYELNSDKKIVLSTTRDITFATPFKRINFSAQPSRLTNGTLLTIVTTSNPDTDREQWTVEQLSGDDVKKLARFLRGL